MAGTFFRRFGTPFRRAVLACLMPLGCCILFSQSGAILEKHTFSAGGRDQTTLRIQNQGRYSIRVQSDFGVAVTVVDAMSGVLASDGSPGQADGRVDLTLEKSSYLVRLEGAENIQGKAELTVEGFTETQIEDPNLKPVALRQVSLADMAQVRFQFTLAQPEILRLELMGRYLEDAAIWFPNGWTTGLRPTRTVYEPEPGKPMTHLEFHHPLPEGTYELVCYGGHGQTWSVSDAATPLYLRWDPRIWGEAGVHEITVSPFGRESFLLEGATNYFEVVRDEVKETRLRRHPMNRADSSRFEGGSYTAQLSPKAKVPQLSLRTGTTSLPQWVIVEAAPGDQLTLRYFPWQYRPNIVPKPNRQYIGTLHEAKMAQTLGATGLLWAKPSGGDPLFVQTLSLNTSLDAGWWRQIDLQDTLEAWVRIAQKGSYTFSQEENARADVKFRLTPFSNSNANFPFRNAGEIFDLAPGFYLLTVQPQRKGLLKMGFGPAGQTFDFTATPPPAMPEIAWTNVSLPFGGSASTFLYLPNQNRIAKYAFQRDWPLVLSDPLPLALNRLEGRPLDIDLVESRIISVDSPLQILSIDGKAYLPEVAVPKGKHSIVVHNPSGRIAYGTLAAWPDSAAKSEGQAQLSTAQQIEIDHPQYFDLDREGTRHFFWTLPKSGLYRLETTGRLPTTITVNSRTKANLFQGSQNGQGRNALVQQYFKAGEYVVTVGVAGKAKGRLGFRITPNQLTDGGALELGRFEKRTLEADQSVRYQFSIVKPGHYQIRTIGLDAAFPARLEDAQGWPVTNPGTSEAIEAALLPGEYHYYTLATPTPSRRLTRLISLEKPKPLTGKGPHRLTWGQPAQAIWRDGSPDLFDLEVSAPTMASFTLTRGMVSHLDGFTEPIYGGEVWERELNPGVYRLQVKRIDQDDYFNYSLQVTTTNLIPGTSQVFTELPRTFDVVLAEQGLVTFAFEGQSDIRAELHRTGAETPILLQDDSSNDWNPRMNLRLPGGAYQLKVFPVGVFSGTSSVTMTVMKEQTLPAGTLPLKLDRPDGLEVVRLPFQLKRDQLVHIERTHGTEVNFSLIAESKELARDVDSLLIPLRKGKTYELWAWSDSGDGFSLSVKPEATKSVSVSSPEQSLPKAGALFLEAPSAHTYRLTPQPGLWFSANWERPLHPLTDPLLNLAEGQGWLVGLGTKTKITELNLNRDRPLELVIGEVQANLKLQTDGPGLVFIDTVDPLWRAALSDSQVLENPWAGMTLTASGPVLAVGDAGTHRIRLWRQEAPTVPTPLRLAFHPFEFKTSGEVGTTPSVAVGQALSLPLDGGIKGLILSPDTYAICWGDHQPKAFFHAQSESQAFLVEAESGQLIIFNNGRSPSPFRVLARAPYRREAWSASARNHWEKAWSADSQIELTIQGENPGTLHGQGEGVRLRFHGRDGSYWEGEPPISKPFREGRLSIDHGEGWLSLWHSKSGDASKAWLGEVASSEPFQADNVPLSAGLKAFQLSIESAQFLQFTMDQPGLLALEKAGEVVQLGAAGNGRDLVLGHYFQPGSYRLLARPFDFAPSPAQLSKQPIQIQTAIPDSPTYIANGEIQVFQFEVSQKAKVGLGLKSSSDHLQAKLMEESGTFIASGNLIIETLAQGRYLLVVNNPGQPVLFQPLLLGLNGSKIDIPDEVMTQYFTVR